MVNGLLRSTICTVGGEWNLTEVKASISQGIPKVTNHAIYHWKALWNGYHKCKKNFNFSTFGRFLGLFLKKLCFWKMGNFKTNEDFWMKLSVKLP